jgi:hypothetical protein
MSVGGESMRRGLNRQDSKAPRARQLIGDLRSGECGSVGRLATTQRWPGWETGRSGCARGGWARFGRPAVGGVWLGRETGHNAVAARLEDRPQWGEGTSGG